MATGFDLNHDDDRIGADTWAIPTPWASRLQPGDQVTIAFADTTFRATATITGHAHDGCAIARLDDPRRSRHALPGGDAA